MQVLLFAFYQPCEDIPTSSAKVPAVKHCTIGMLHKTLYKAAFHIIKITLVLLQVLSLMANYQVNEGCAIAINEMFVFKHYAFKQFGKNLDKDALALLGFYAFFW